MGMHMGIDRLPGPREEVQLSPSEERLLAELAGVDGVDAAEATDAA